MIYHYSLSYDNKKAKPNKDSIIVGSWGWYDPILSEAELQELLFDTIHSEILLEKEINFKKLHKLSQNLGLETTWSKKVENKMLKSLEENNNIFQWPPKTPNHALKRDDWSSSILNNRIRLKLLEEYKSFDERASLPEQFAFPEFRETLLNWLQVSGVWFNEKKRKPNKRVLNGRETLEKYRIMDPFIYNDVKRTDNQCQHEWVALVNPYSYIRKWFCLNCLKEFICSCDAEVISHRRDKNNREYCYPVLKGVCPSCRQIPDLNPPSIVQLMYFSTLFDIVHYPESKYIYKMEVLKIAKEKNIYFEDAEEYINTKYNRNWHIDMIREAHGFHKVGEKWVNETMMVNSIKKVFPEYEVIREASPAWIKPQRLDAYIPELSLAFEYQGEQHFKVVDHFGGNEGLEKRKEMDLRKKELCKANNVTLIEFFYGEMINENLVKKKLSL